MSMAFFHAPTTPPQQVVWRLRKHDSTAVAVIRHVPSMGRELRITVDGILYWCALYRHGGQLEPMAAQHRTDFQRLGWVTASRLGDIIERVRGHVIR